MSTLDVRHSTHPAEMRHLGTQDLRDRFLVSDLFEPGRVRMCLAHDDRLVIGGVRPAGQRLPLPNPPELRAQFFCERRELAVVSLRERGVVHVDEQTYRLGRHDVLYVGAGAREVVFDAGPEGSEAPESDAAGYYLVSAPTTVSHPTAVVPRAEANTLHMGESSAANVRTIRQYLHPDGTVAADRLVLGITTLAEGSVWNTMPPHLHDRRTEIYLYTDLRAEDRIVHLCGEPSDTRTILVANHEAVISPPWSIHSGAGTGAYSFVWAMSGENRAFTDMDQVRLEDLR